MQVGQRPTPKWVADPTGWAGFEEADAGFAEKTARAHVQRWQQYRQQAMTPVTHDAPFLRALAEALRREVVFVPDVPPEKREVKGPLPTTRPAAPDGPMTEPMLDGLAAAVRDALVVLQDRTFEEQRDRYFAGRVVRIDDPETDAATIERKLGERVDVAALSDAQIWQYLHRLYDHRRAAFDGGFNVTSAALDGSRGLAGQIFYRTADTGYGDGITLARGNPSGTGWDDYWRAGLLVCGRQFTHPPVSQETLLQRDGRVLRADVQAIVEMKNGERAPMLMTLFYEPHEKRWWVSSCCFSSSPFVSMAGQAK